MAKRKPVPNVLELLLTWHLSADTDITTRTYHRWSGSTPTNTALSELCTIVATATTTYLHDIYSEHVSQSEVELTDLTSETAGRGQATGAGAGGLTGYPASLSTCLLVNYHIARRYRGGKPRNYFPFGTGAEVEDSRTWESVFLALAQEKLTDYGNAIVGSTAGGVTLGDHVNVSYYEGFTNEAYGSPQKYRRVPTPRESPLIDEVTDFSCNAIPGSQRRRYQRSS